MNVATTKGSLTVVDVDASSRLTVTDVAAEYERLRREGAPVTGAMRREPWGERQFQLTDPSGVVVRLTDGRRRPAPPHTTD